MKLREMAHVHIKESLLAPPPPLIMADTVDNAHLLQWYYIWRRTLLKDMYAIQLDVQYFGPLAEW